MQDNLKDHIDAKREDFELYPFESDQEWAKISEKIVPANGKKDPWKYIGIAACFALIVGSTFFFIRPTNEGGEVAEIENFYATEINQKVSLIKNHQQGDYILKDLEEMDAVFAELKSDLKDNVDNEEVITALMENYRLKLQILEEILNELEKEQGEEVL